MTWDAHLLSIREKVTVNLRILREVKLAFLIARTWLIYTGRLNLIFITAALREIQ